MKTLEMKWTGLRPLVMHNGRLADPDHPISVELKNLTSKKKKSEEVRIKIARVEWEGGLYWSETTGGPVIPSDNIERCLQIGAQGKKNGKYFQAAVLCSDVEAPLIYDGPKTIDALYADKNFVLRKGVVVKRNRIIRTRPMFRAWAIFVKVDYDEEIVNESDIIDASTEGGSLGGICDWRPKYGRFAVEVLK